MVGKVRAVGVSVRSEESRRVLCLRREPDDVGGRDVGLPQASAVADTLGTRRRRRPVPNPCSVAQKSGASRRGRIPRESIESDLLFNANRQRVACRGLSDWLSRVLGAPRPKVLASRFAWRYDILLQSFRCLT